MSDDPFRARGPIPGARGKTDFKDHTDTEAEESASAGAANVLDADRDEVTRCGISCAAQRKKPAIDLIAGFPFGWWLFTDSNRGPVDYDSIALTD